MRNIVIPLMIVLILIAVIPNWASGSDQPSRAELLPLYVEYGTYRFDNSTGSAMFDTITIGPEGRLEIVGVSVVATRVVTTEEQPNSSIYIHGTQESWGYLIVKEGELDVQVNNISMGRAEVSVLWSEYYLSPGDAGQRSLLRMETLGGGINIVGTKIEVMGQEGGGGDDENYGGAGGDAEIFLQDTREGEIRINGGWVRSTGGKGGGAPSGKVNSGRGGQSDISIDGSSVNISCSLIMSYGGKAGPVSQGAEGNTGGSGMMRVLSNFGLTLYDTDLTALPGNNTGFPQYPSPSTIILRAEYGSVRWDHNKPKEDERSTLSYLDTFSLQVDAEFGARFHQVHMRDTFPTSLDNTKISIYWWIDLFVTDDLGSPIRNAIVYYNINEGIETYPDATNPLIAGENGYVSLELLANDGMDWRRYRFFAQFGSSAATGGTDVTRFDLNSNRVGEIHIDLADIEVDTNMEAPVLDLWNITGTAFSRTGEPITSMKMYIGGELAEKVIDNSNDPSEPFSFWSIPLQTSKIPPGTHIFELLITIGDFTTRMNWTVEFPRSFYNHPPLIDEVMFVTDVGLFESKRDVEYPIHVTSANPGFTLNVKTMELDHNSDLLEDGEGVWITRLNVQIIMYGHTLEVFSSERTYTQYDAGDNGRYHSIFNIDTSVRGGRFDPWPSGRYLVKINATDDAGLAALEFQVLLSLHVGHPPLLQLRLGKENPTTTETHPTRIEKAFFFDIAEDREVTYYFDLTGCKDMDDPGYFPHPSMDRSWMNLTTTVYIQPAGKVPVQVFGPKKGAMGFEHSFDLKNYSYGDSIIFEILLKVEDADGIESELTVIADIAVGPPEVKPAPLPPWVLIAIAIFWLAAMLIAFIVVLPIYTRRKTDRVRRLLKDPTLKEATREAMKGEKPSNYSICREDVVGGLIEKIENGKIPRKEYEQITNDIKSAQEKVSINADQIK